MTLARGDLPYLDQVPELQRLQGLTPGLGFLPLYLLAGGAAAGATLSSWLANDDWSTGEYAEYMREMDDTLHLWDKLGWQTGCWEKNPLKREEWMALWKRFSKHYAKGLPQYVLTDSYEKPARTYMAKLKYFGDWLSATCKADIGAGAPTDTHPLPPPPDDNPWISALKWGAVAIGVVGLAYGLSTVRGIASDFRQDHA